MSELLFVLSIVVVFGTDKKRHDCVHDQLDHKPWQHHVNYHNHPYDLNRIRSRFENLNKRHLLETQSEYEPIRIKPYFDPLTINNNTLSASNQSYIKSLVSASIHYLESFISVIPVDGPLFISKCQYTCKPFESYAVPCCVQSQYESDTSCGAAIIPEEHFGESWYYGANYKSELYESAGSGISDADLAIYVTYGSEGCSEYTLAWATPCTLDQFGRPVSGGINFCPSVLTNPYWKYDVAVALHELTHVLIMHSWLWNYFYDGDNNKFRDLTDIVGSDGINNYIISNKVQTLSQKHFACDTLDGAPIENIGGICTDIDNCYTNGESISSHWEQKYLMFEYMNAVIYSGMVYVSDFTLALMDDSGWYQVDYNYSNDYRWGADQGCSFFTTDCVTGSISNFEQFWCEGYSDDGCSFDYSTLSDCVNYAGFTLPVDFRWYTDDTTFGGAETTDYCAFRDPESHFTYIDYENVCWDERGNTLSPTSYPTSIYNISSRCVDTINTVGTEKGYCFKHECIDYDISNQRYSAVRILLDYNNDLVYTCLRNQTLEEIQTNYSTISSIKCPDVDAICGTSTAPFDCYWGEYNDYLAECICSPGYIGIDCNTQDINNFVDEAVLSTMTTSTPLSELYDISSVCVSGTVEYDGIYEIKTSDTNEGLLFYQGNNGYIYYRRFISAWAIGPTLGGNNYDGYCTQFIADSGDYNSVNIQDCLGWYFYQQSSYVLDEDAIAVYNESNCPTTTTTTTTTDNTDNSNEAKLQSLFMIVHVIVFFYVCKCVS